MRTKKVSYYRCCLTNPNVQFDLEQEINTAWEQLDTTKKREFTISGKNVYGMKLEHKTANFRQSRPKCTLISIGLYENKTPANLIDHPTNQFKESSSDEFPAPESKEFLEGEAFICLYKNHILIVPSITLRVNKIESFIREILIKAKLLNDKTHGMLTLKKIANDDVIKQIMSEGVKQIKLDASCYRASMLYNQEEQTSNDQNSDMGIFYKVGQWVHELFETDESEENFKNNSNMTANIILKQNGKLDVEEQNHLQEKLKPLAAAITNKASDYEIVTQAGNTIEPDQITMSESIKAKKHGKLVDRSDVFSQLVLVLDKYERNGTLIK